MVELVGTASATARGAYLRALETVGHMDRHDDLVGVAARLMPRELLDLARIYENGNAWGRAPMEGARKSLKSLRL